MFNTIDLTISVGNSNPSESYQIEYFDADEGDFATRTISPNGRETITTDKAHSVTVRSMNSDNDQSWMLDADLISGRGRSVTFAVPDTNGGLTIARTLENMSIILNTINGLTGGMSEYGYSDFNVA